MTIKNYLIIENNVVTNTVVWDGNPNTWQPPIDSIQLVLETTGAMLWVLNTERTEFVLEEQLGAGSIGFTWDGSVLTTNEPKPEIK
jgi:hypothetical protein